MIRQTAHRLSFFQIMTGRAVLSVLACALALTAVVLTGTSAQAGTSPPAVEAGDPQTVNAGSIVTLNGSADAVEFATFMTYTWSKLSGAAVTFLDPPSGVTPTVAANQGVFIIPAVTFTAPATAGPLVFQLAAYPNTASFATGTDTVTITVIAPPSPEEAIATLRIAVQALVPDTLNGGLGNALISKLDGALAKIADDNVQPAINKLQAFINQVQALVNGGTLSTAQGQPLLDAAMVIIAQLEA